jgi:hypothetical protein
MTRSRPTRARTSSTASSMIDVWVQVGRAPHTSNRNDRSTSWPRSVCTTSGWNCTPYTARSRSSSAAIGAPGVDAVTVKPSGARVIASPWLIHTICSAASGSSTSDAASLRCITVRPYSPPPVRSTSPPRSRATSWAP